jgi:hypothetical protein
MYKKLLQLLTDYNFKPQKGNSVAEFRKGNLTANVGYTQKFFTRDQKPVKSLAMIANNDEIYNECKRLFPDFEFNGVQINKNFKCEPHRDSKNIGDSLLMGLGDYEGGCTEVESLGIVDIKYKPVIFNGNELLHSTLDFTGDRYSIVLFRLKQEIKNIKYAIPSYKRSDVIIKKTLSLLYRYGIITDITIFVANKEEKKIYQERIKNHKIVVGELGITHQRNYIQNYYKTNDCVVVLDDDIEEIETLSEDRKKFVPVDDILSIFEKGFLECKQRDTNLWGIYGSHNCMFMRNNFDDKNNPITVGLTFIIGCLYGLIIEKDMTPYQLDKKLVNKQDYEQSILHYLDKGNVVRLNHYTIKTKFYAPGGLGAVENRLASNEIDANLLLEKYPTLLTTYIRKNGITEVRLNNKFSKKLK